MENRPPSLRSHICSQGISGDVCSEARSERLCVGCVCVWGECTLHEMWSQNFPSIPLRLGEGLEPHAALQVKSEHENTSWESGRCQSHNSIQNALRLKTVLCDYTKWVKEFVKCLSIIRVLWSQIVTNMFLALKSPHKAHYSDRSHRASAC